MLCIAFSTSIRCVSYKMFGAMFGGFAGGTFEANYRCYPVSFLDKLEAENGDKIFLPPSALDRLGTRAASEYRKMH